MKHFARLLAITALPLIAACSQQPAPTADPENNNVAAAAAMSNDAILAEQVRLADEAARFTAQRQRQAIAQVLVQDQATSSYGLSFSRIEAMRAIDLINTPLEFQQAYLSHIHAWENNLELERAWQSLVNDEQMGAVVVGQIACAFLDCASDPIVDQMQAEMRIRKEKEVAAMRVNSTFQTMEQIAAKFSVM